MCKMIYTINVKHKNAKKKIYKTKQIVFKQF